MFFPFGATTKQVAKGSSENTHSIIGLNHCSIFGWLLVNHLIWSLSLHCPDLIWWTFRPQLPQLIRAPDSRVLSGSFKLIETRPWLPQSSLSMSRFWRIFGEFLSPGDVGAPLGAMCQENRTQKRPDSKVDPPVLWPANLSKLGHH